MAPRSQQDQTERGSSPGAGREGGESGAVACRRGKEPRALLPRSLSRSDPGGAGGARVKSRTRGEAPCPRAHSGRAAVSRQGAGRGRSGCGAAIGAGRGSGPGAGGAAGLPPHPPLLNARGCAPIAPAPQSGFPTAAAPPGRQQLRGINAERPSAAAAAPSPQDPLPQL